MFGPSRKELAHQLERERARNVQREGELVDRIMFLSGNMWTPPPPAQETDRPDAEPMFESALAGPPPYYDED